MAYNVKDVVANKPSRFTEGHRMCAGCGATICARNVLPGQPGTLGNVQNEQFPRRYSNMAGTLRPYFGRLRTAANVR